MSSRCNRPLSTTSFSQLKIEAKILNFPYPLHRKLPLKPVLALAILLELSVIVMFILLFFITELIYPVSFRFSSEVSVNFDTEDLVD